MSLVFFGIIYYIELPYIEKFNHFITSFTDISVGVLSFNVVSNRLHLREIV